MVIAGADKCLTQRCSAHCEPAPRWHGSQVRAAAEPPGRYAGRSPRTRSAIWNYKTRGKREEWGFVLVPGLHPGTGFWRRCRAAGAQRTGVGRRVGSGGGAASVPGAAGGLFRSIPTSDGARSGVTRQSGMLWALPPATRRPAATSATGAGERSGTLVARPANRGLGRDLGPQALGITGSIALVPGFHPGAVPAAS
jgi:hypothetical protein